MMKPLLILVFMSSLTSPAFSSQEVSETQIEKTSECRKIWRYYSVMGSQELIQKVMDAHEVADGDTCPMDCELIIQPDGYLSCENCAAISRKKDNCPVHGKLTIIKDRAVPEEDLLRALHTLPYGLFVSKSTIPNAGLGLFTSVDIPAMVRLGPYEGSFHGREMKDPDVLLYSWQIVHDDGQVSLVNALNVSHSNYLRYVNMPNCKEDENIFAIQYHLQVYYVTINRIPAGSELFVWYGDKYSKYLGLHELECNKDGRISDES